MGNNIPNGGTLKEYRTLMLEILKRVDTRIDDVRDDVSDVKSDIKSVRTIDIPKIQNEITVIQTERKIKTIIYGTLGGGTATLFMGIFLWWLNSL